MPVSLESVVGYGYDNRRQRVLELKTELQQELLMQLRGFQSDANEAAAKIAQMADAQKAGIEAISNLADEALQIHAMGWQYRANSRLSSAEDVATAYNAAQEEMLSCNNALHKSRRADVKAIRGFVEQLGEIEKLVAGDKFLTDKDSLWMVSNKLKNIQFPIKDRGTSCDRPYGKLLKAKNAWEEKFKLGQDTRADNLTGKSQELLFDISRLDSQMQDFWKTRGILEGLQELIPNKKHAASLQARGEGFEVTF